MNTFKKSIEKYRLAKRCKKLLGKPLSSYQLSWIMTNTNIERLWTRCSGGSTATMLDAILYAQDNANSTQIIFTSNMTAGHFLNDIICFIDENRKHISSNHKIKKNTKREIIFQNESKILFCYEIESLAIGKTIHRILGDVQNCEDANKIYDFFSKHPYIASPIIKIVVNSDTIGHMIDVSKKSYQEYCAQNRNRNIIHSI